MGSSDWWRLKGSLGHVSSRGCFQRGDRGRFAIIRDSTYVSFILSNFRFFESTIRFHYNVNPHLRQSRRPCAYPDTFTPETNFNNELISCQPPALEGTMPTHLWRMRTT